MRCLYLDHNIYIYALSDSSIKDAVQQLSEKDIRCVYSPAHIEEIYKAELDAPDENYRQTAQQLIRLISDFTGNWELLPASKIILKNEKPSKCYQRVAGFDTTERVRLDSRYKYQVDRENYHEMIKQDKHNTSLSTLSCADIWKHPTISAVVNNLNQHMEYVIQRKNVSMDTLLCSCLGADKSLPLSFRLTRNSFSELKASHTQLEFAIEILFRILSQNGYNADKSENTAISGTHDITHAIYATEADWLITTDKHFSARCKAVYTFLGVPTEVVFCARDQISQEISKL